MSKRWGTICIELTEEQFDKLWAEFSNIQKAEYLVVDDESMARFTEWFVSRDDEDAWA